MKGTLPIKIGGVLFLCSCLGACSSENFFAGKMAMVSIIDYLCTAFEESKESCRSGRSGRTRNAVNG